MADEFVVANVKEAVRLARAGKLDESFARYQALFDARQFALAPVDHQRQALKLMVTAKVPEPLSGAAISALQAAWRSLTRLTQVAREPQDYELLGLTHIALGDPKGAKQVFEIGLAAAHASNDAQWAGQLLKRISFL